jgi:hypothetical protein
VTYYRNRFIALAFVLFCAMAMGGYAQALTASPSDTTIPAATQIVDVNGNVWKLSGGMVYENGNDVSNGEVILLLFYNGAIYQEKSGNRWWKWDGNSWASLSGDPRGAYFVYVDTASVNFTDPQAPAQMEFVNDSFGSAYNGGAVYMVGEYDTAHHTSFSQEFGPALAAMQQIPNPARVWPLINWTRIVGYNSCGSGGNPSWCSPAGSTYAPPAQALSYYENINGIDIYNQQGALTDFLNLFSDALQASLALGAPGVVIDSESYNSYKIENLPLLATLYPAETVQDIINQLNYIGSQMADIVNTEYPNAVILIFATNLFNTQNSGYASPETYVWQGMLARAKAQNYRFTLVDGGQGDQELGFCWPYLSGSYPDYPAYYTLEGAAAQFSSEFSPFLNQASQTYYPNLQLGGTIAPWAYPSDVDGWFLLNPPDVSAGYCGQALGTLTTAADFTPFLSYLNNSYKYVWVLAAWDAQYSAYYAQLTGNPAAVNTATAINQALQNAK